MWKAGKRPHIVMVAGPAVQPGHIQASVVTIFVVETSIDAPLAPVIATTSARKVQMVEGLGCSLTVPELLESTDW